MSNHFQNPSSSPGPSQPSGGHEISAEERESMRASFVNLMFRNDVPPEVRQLFLSEGRRLERLLIPLDILEQLLQTEGCQKVAVEWGASEGGVNLILYAIDAQGQPVGAYYDRFFKCPPTCL